MILNLNGSGSVRLHRKKAVFTGSRFGIGSIPCKRVRPFPLYSESYYIAESDFFSFQTIQMQKMSYLKVEPRRNVTIHAQHATANCFFHRRRMMQWLSLSAGSTGIVEHKQARPFHCTLHRIRMRLRVIACDF